MERISDAQLFDLFLQTLGRCGTFLLECDAQDVEVCLFEEFDGDSISFLHENSLNRLLDGHYISTEVYSLCQLLCKKFRDMEGTSLWNVDSVKSNPEWKEILTLSDRIKSMINGECNIDRIMYLIAWGRTESEQQEGIAMARKVSCLKAFCQPFGPLGGKGVWENCAVILCERSDEELEPYISDMLLWLSDLNWPGAELIQKRLIQFQKVDKLAMWLNDWVPALNKLEQWAWLSFISDLLDNSGLKDLLKPDVIRMLQ